MLTTFVGINPNDITSANIDYNDQNLGDRIPHVITLFQNQKGSWISSNCQHIEVNGVHYYGIHKQNQMQTDIKSTRQLYQDIKSYVLQNMGMNPETKIVQVVGDSVSFSQQGTKAAKNFLKSNLRNDEIILYGYTGHAETDGTRCVNAVVTDVINEQNNLDHLIGNLVGFHTPAALKSWNCTGPELKHYVVVYGDDETSRENGTVFGDDVVSSDFFADSLLVLDGGAQSFRQACNALLLDQNIQVLMGLRDISKGWVVEDINDTKITTRYFAASIFLNELKTLLEEKGDNINADELNQWYSCYFGRGKCYVGDPKRQDFDTKQKLINDAWKLLVEERLDRKIKTLVTTMSNSSKL